MNRQIIKHSGNSKKWMNTSKILIKIKLLNFDFLNCKTKFPVFICSFLAWYNYTYLEALLLFTFILSLISVKSVHISKLNSKTLPFPIFNLLNYLWPFFGALVWLRVFGWFETITAPLWSFLNWIQKRE